MATRSRPLPGPIGGTCEQDHFVPQLLAAAGSLFPTTWQPHRNQPLQGFLLLCPPASPSLCPPVAVHTGARAERVWRGRPVQSHGDSGPPGAPLPVESEMHLPPLGCGQRSWCDVCTPHVAAPRSPAERPRVPPQSREPSGCQAPERVGRGLFSPWPSGCTPRRPGTGRQGILLRWSPRGLPFCPDPSPRPGPGFVPPARCRVLSLPPPCRVTETGCVFRGRDTAAVSLRCRWAGDPEARSKWTSSGF